MVFDSGLEPTTIHKQFKKLKTFKANNTAVIYTGCPDTLYPPPQHNWAVPDPKPIYFLDTTSIPDLHARFQITNFIYLLPVTRFIMRDRGRFCEQKICFIFWGAITKMAIQLSIIGVDPYTIPCLKANILCHAVKL